MEYKELKGAPVWLQGVRWGSSLTGGLPVFAERKEELELEKYFPQRVRWKLRACADDGIYVGAKDFG